MTNASTLIHQQPPFLGFVSPDWLESVLGQENLRIVQLDGEKYYSNFHIPGAVNISYSRIVTKRGDVPGMLADPEDLALELGRQGIGPTTPVLAYDLTGGLDAARFLWTLVMGGHTGFRAVLDGGLNTWYSQSRPMESGAVTVAALDFPWRPDSRHLAGYEEVLAIAEGRRDAALLDTRTEKEYLGLTVRAPHGHIAGAAHFDWTDSLVGPKDLRLKNLTEIEERLAGLGIVEKNREVVLYCETAHRASHTWLLLRHLGFENARLYDGSIAEWRVRNLPVTT
ncbi:MAG: sulfurtransferase [Magnetococcales bacterium]|nr:sulfurtransferase [Magnetococcales bacterium]